MELEKAREKAWELINKYCPNYNFRFSNGKNIYGTCNNNTKTIKLSKTLTLMNEEKIVVNVLLHEIAHALTPGHRHDKVWRAKALEIGCDGKRLQGNAESPKGKFIYECSDCKKEYYFHRRVRRERACFDCCTKYNNGNFNKKYLIVPKYIQRSETGAKEEATSYTSHLSVSPICQTPSQGLSKKEVVKNANNTL